MSACSPIRGFECQILCNLGLPPVAIGQQPLLVVEELFVGLRRELEVRPFDDRINRASLLAIAAVNAFRHVDVVARRTTAAVLARLGLDRDRERRANRLAQLARDAALFAVGVAPQRVFASKARAEW